MNPPGDRIGRFELVTRLDGGGGCSVFHAFDPLLRRDVVIRRLEGWAALDRRQRWRAGVALQRFARLEHDHLVPIYEVHLEGTPPWLAERHLSGGSLEAPVLEARPRPALALALAREIGAALRRIHAEGLAHGDVRPSRILRSARGDLHLVALPRRILVPEPSGPPAAQPGAVADWHALASMARTLLPAEVDADLQTLPSPLRALLRPPDEHRAPDSGT